MIVHLRTLLVLRRTAGERGASAVEYGLLIAGIAALIVGVVFVFGDNVSDLFADTCAAVASSSSCTSD